ncbi:MAG: hypothetical protein ABI977_06975 [Acidobacteriota bacterium]
MKNDLIIPIYLDTNALLDLIASIEGGFSVVEKITSKQGGSSTTEGNIKADAGTEFGVPNVLSLLKVNLGFSVNKKKADENTTQQETERYHTYGSLFYKLFAYLDGQGLVRLLDGSKESWDNIKASDFVEIRGLFRPNPLANSLQIIDRIISMYHLVSGFSSFQWEQGKARLSAEEKKKLQDQKEQEKLQLKQFEQIRHFISGVLKDIQSENIRIFVIDSTEGYKSVASLFSDYFRDRSLIEVSYKEYRMVGKVVRKIEKNSGETIDLLIGTGFGGIGKETLEQLVGAFSQLPGLSLPNIQTEVSGPALEIVPIAVFV